MKSTSFDNGGVTTHTHNITYSVEFGDFQALRANVCLDVWTDKCISYSTLKNFFRECDSSKLVGKSKYWELIFVPEFEMFGDIS